MLAAVSVLAACATEDDVPVVRWSRPGASYDQFVADRAACVKETREQSAPFFIGGAPYGNRRSLLNTDLFVSCMSRHGFSRDPKGFAAPPGEEVPLGP
ncbi:MAG TPA: hypothetical protein VGI20_13545 [Rhizomicrobium sp.]|jgi:hypothetical protein